ncbi:MAG: hypothetical protein J0H98_07900 [Solirubrobacterales bacterium]|nr:hypothetical protein [Solirubrobacterales bacterium]
MTRRPAWPVLGLGMLVSLGVCLHVARGSTYSSDELAWVAGSPSMSFGDAFDPYSGHLVLLSHLVYKFVLETIGSGYLTFRLLSLASVFLAVGLLFVWARRRVDEWIALAPCLVLLFFGSDSAHILQGNGFTVILAVACGMLALVALDRPGGRWDLVACLALCLGVVTYTVALPFVAGAAVLILARADRLRRSWIFLVPAGIYLAWRIWVQATGADLEAGGVDLINLLLLPAWSFQGIGASLAALTGVDFDFNATSEATPGFAGPALAVAFLALLCLRLRREGPGPTFWAVTAVALAMFALQVASWIPGLRLPDSTRYLYPGAFVILLVAFEAGRGIRVPRVAVAAIWIVALAGLGANLTIIRDNGEIYRERAEKVSAQITASTMIHRMGEFAPGPGAKPLASLVETYSPAITEIGPAAGRYGLGIPGDEIAGRPEPTRAQIDSILIGAIGPRLVPIASRPGDCSPAEPVAGSYLADLPPGGAVLEGNRGGTVGIGRFSDRISATVGTLEAGRPALLAIPEDGAETPWKAGMDVPFKVCAAPGS